MQVRVIPIRARRMIEADPVLVLARLARLDAERRIVHHVVAVDARRDEPGIHVQPVGVQIGAVGVAQVRRPHAARRIGRQLVDEPDAQAVANVDPERRRGNAAVHRAQPHGLAVERRVGVGEGQRDVELAANRREDRRLDESLPRQRRIRVAAAGPVAVAAAAAVQHGDCEAGAQRPTEAKEIAAPSGLRLVLLRVVVRHRR